MTNAWLNEFSASIGTDDQGAAYEREAQALADDGVDGHISVYKLNLGYLHFAFMRAKGGQAKAVGRKRRAESLQRFEEGMARRYD